MVTLEFVDLAPIELGCPSDSQSEFALLQLGLKLESGIAHRLVLWIVFELHINQLVGGPGLLLILSINSVVFLAPLQFIDVEGHKVKSYSVFGVAFSTSCLLASL